ncbi:MAG TPA: AAA family ATPase, partial [Burkholderiaceae bacterium]
APSLRGVARVPLERKAAALLALLALDGARPRADLAALLWPEASAAQARNSLRQRLFRLQRAAGRDLVVGGHELRLAEGVTHDLADAAARLGSDPQARLGELLGGLDYGDCLALSEWVEMARERWREQRRSLLAGLAVQHEARGELARALRYAERLAADAPLLEHAHRRVMRLHYLRGDRGAALAAFDRCRELLKAELRARPDRETSELAALIGSGAPLPSAVRAIAPPLTVLRPPRLIGRVAERARLDAALAGRGALLVAGDPGIGKTRLLEDALAAHPALLGCGAQVGEARLPYALLGRLVREAQRHYPVAHDGWVGEELARLAPELGRAPACRLDTLRLHQALAAALDAWAGAGLGGIAVDDLHHADEASLEALLALAAPARSRRLAWLLGVRSHEMPAALAALVGERDGAALDALRLDALDATAIGELLGSLALPRFDPARWAAPLTAHSGGNPLFALETVRALVALGDALPEPRDARLPVPGALSALIERRLARLSEPALRLLRVAALAGTDFDADVAAGVLDAHPLDIVEPWRELEQAQLLRERRFTHDLIAEGVLHALPQAIARTLHARLAGRLESLGRAPARVAPHWAEAGEWARAGEAYALAAREAQRASRRADEVGLWEQAAACYDRAGMTGRAFDARADSVEPVIFVRGVQAATQLAERLAADAQTEPQRLRALTCRANVALMAGDHARGEAAAREALAAAARLDALWPRFEAARLLAVALAQAARNDEALQVIEPFRAVVESEGDAEQRQRFWSDYAYVLKAALRLHDCALALRRAMQCAQVAGDYAELATLTSNLATVEGNFGHVDQALDLARRARALRDPLGDVGGPAAGAIDLYVAIYSAACGRYGDALDNLDRAAACFAGNGQTVWSALAANHRANVLLHLGQH